MTKMIEGKDIDRPSVKLVEDIFRGSPLEMTEKMISGVFKDNPNHTDEFVIAIRARLIDSCYSTNINRRLYGFDGLVAKILELEEKGKNWIKKVEKDHCVLILMEILNSKIGITKDNAKRGHAVSFFTKYFFYRTSFDFPIYDKLRG